MVQALRADGSIPTVDPEAEVGTATTSLYQNLYEAARYDLLEHFESHAKALLTDTDASVQRAVLGSVSSLCVFFGSPKANDVILSHLNTYLNDTDWLLKYAFFQTIVGVATFVGGASLEDFLLPLMVQALSDPEDFVVESVLASFASMAELGLFQRSTTWEMVDVVARFMVHPNIWIREAAVHYISSSTRFLSQADTNCIILPLIRPYVKTRITEFSETTILDALRKPLPRPIFDMAVTWATMVEHGVFWKPTQQQHTFSFGSPDHAIPAISSKDLASDVLSKVPKNDEDEQWLSRLRNLGMVSDDEWKIVALREYIRRMASKRAKDGTGEASRLNSIMRLRDLDITPQTVFFENHRNQKSILRRLSHGNVQANGTKRPHSIADALLDASTTINDSQNQRKKSYINTINMRGNGDSMPTSLMAGFPDSRRGPSNIASPLSSSPATRAVSRNHTIQNTALPTWTTTRISNPLSSADEARSDGTITPTESLSPGGVRDRLNGVRHRSSAINLLNRKDTPKTVAETGTVSTNVTGEMDAPKNAEGDDASSALNGQMERRASPLASIRAGHTYEGNDPNVANLLDNLASDNYPIDLVDFGPLVTPVHKKVVKKVDPHEVEVPWRPQGIHVATFGEHTGPINRVLPSPDHAFFITASDDGTVKVWDTSRLERNLIHRSRQTHKHADGAKVQSICFVENTHTFVSCASDGIINVVKVDCTSVGDTARYGKLRLVRQHQLPEGQWAIWSEHFKADAKSVLILATNTSRILAIDLRTMDILYEIPTPAYRGTPTTFVIDKKHHWLLLGTAHGILSLWDLRFRLCVRAWGIPGGKPIHRLAIHLFKGRGKWVIVAGGTPSGDITIWDIEKLQCREVYRIGGGTTSDSLKAYEPWRLDDAPPDAMLTRFGTALEPRLALPDTGIRTIALGIDSPEDGRDAKSGFLISGGADRKLRFWDLAHVEASAVISGLEPDEPQPKYLATHPSPSLLLNIERVPQSGPSAPNAGVGEGKGEGAKSNSGKRRERERPSRTAVMAASQKGLLRGHLDVITDVCLVERPVGMSVSVDRRGCVYVFQ